MQRRMGAEEEGMTRVERKATRLDRRRDVREAEQEETENEVDLGDDGEKAIDIEMVEANEVDIGDAKENADQEDFSMKCGVCTMKWQKRGKSKVTTMLWNIQWRRRKLKNEVMEPANKLI